MCILLLEVWLCGKDVACLTQYASMASSGYLDAIKTSARADNVELEVIKTWLSTYTCLCT